MVLVTLAVGLVAFASPVSSEEITCAGKVNCDALEAFFANYTVTKTLTSWGWYWDEWEHCHVQDESVSWCNNHMQDMCDCTRKFSQETSASVLNATCSLNKLLGPCDTKYPATPESTSTLSEPTPDPTPEATDASESPTTSPTDRPSDDVFFANGTDWYEETQDASTSGPNPNPTPAPTPGPSHAPTPSPTSMPTSAPTNSSDEGGNENGNSPTSLPVTAPSPSPVAAPTASPVVDKPTCDSQKGCDLPTAQPTASPVKPITDNPTVDPASSPSAPAPTFEPFDTYSMGDIPSEEPTLSPSQENCNETEVTNMIWNEILTDKIWVTYVKQNYSCEVIPDADTIEDAMGKLIHAIDDPKKYFSDVCLMHNPMYSKYFYPCYNSTTWSTPINSLKNTTEAPFSADTGPSSTEALVIMGVVILALCALGLYCQRARNSFAIPEDTKSGKKKRGFEQLGGASDSRARFKGKKSDYNDFYDDNSSDDDEIDDTMVSQTVKLGAQGKNNIELTKSQLRRKRKRRRAGRGENMDDEDSDLAEDDGMGRSRRKASKRNGRGGHEMDDMDEEDDFDSEEGGGGMRMLPNPYAKNKKSKGIAGVLNEKFSTFKESVNKNVSKKLGKKEKVVVIPMSVSASSQTAQSGQNGQQSLQKNKLKKKKKEHRDAGRVGSGIRRKKAAKGTQKALLKDDDSTDEEDDTDDDEDERRGGRKRKGKEDVFKICEGDHVSDDYNISESGSDSESSDAVEVRINKVGRGIKQPMPLPQFYQGKKKDSQVAGNGTETTGKKKKGKQNGLGKEKEKGNGGSSGALLDDAEDDEW